MKALRVALLAGAVAALAACASPPTREAMVVSTPAGKSWPNTVSVQARGGADTTAFGGTQISADEIKGALAQSITDSKLFRAVVQGKDGDCELVVVVTQLSKPVFGATFTVDLETAWSLTKVADKKVLLRKVIKSTNTATMGDAVIAVSRMRQAIEGAVRKNIAQGMQEIAGLDSLD